MTEPQLVQIMDLVRRQEALRAELTFVKAERDEALAQNEVLVSQNAELRAALDSLHTSSRVLLANINSIDMSYGDEELIAPALRSEIDALQVVEFLLVPDAKETRT